ncbi:hypothetical protein ACHQM5_000547 [Ranunculus cassubicifolius]
METNPEKAGAPQVGVYPYNIAFPGQNIGAASEIDWSTGLCGCFEDFRNCCITCWCPCVTVGQIAEVLDRGTTSCVVSAAIYTALLYAGCPCIYSCGFRTKLRKLYSLKEGSCGDCCLHFWCDACAICQEYRELKIRGVDPSIGWEGNVRKWKQGGVEMPPVVAPGMYR